MQPTLTPNPNAPDEDNLAQTKGRLVLVESIYHQQPGDPPTVVEGRWSRWLSSSEQPYVRRIQVTSEWRPIDSGWVGDDCSMLRISNEEGKHLQVIPTEQQKKQMEDRLIEVGLKLIGVNRDDGQDVVVCFLTIPRGLCCRFKPSQLSKLRIRCLSGPCRCNIAAYPI